MTSKQGPMNYSKLNTILLSLILMFAVATFWTLRDIGTGCAGDIILSAEHSARGERPVRGQLRSARAPSPFFIANVSAYCPCELCCGIYADGVTASGHVIQPGDRFVAAPPKYPFGTMLDIPGYGLVPVLDRGGAIKGNKLDVFFPDHKTALLWSRKTLTVTVKGG